MAQNLLDAGYPLVVHDKVPERTAGLVEAGATDRESAASVADECDIVLSMLPSAEAVHDVAMGEGGLTESDGKVWIDFSSIDKRTVIDLNEWLSNRGWRLMDASVNGVEEEAAAGTLRTWASGPRDLFDSYLPVLEVLSMAVVHMGELGNAKLVKTANAMLSGIMQMSMVEVYLWVTAAGMGEDDFESFIRSSRNFSPALERVMTIMLSHTFKERTSWMAKDIGFGLDAARDLEIPVPFSSLVHQMFTVAQANGVDHYEATGVAWHSFAAIAGQDKFPPTTGVPLEP